MFAASLPTAYPPSKPVKNAKKNKNKMPFSLFFCLKATCDLCAYKKLESDENFERFY